MTKTVRTALVLGATGGIGWEAGHALARHGWKIHALTRSGRPAEATSFFVAAVIHEPVGIDLRRRQVVGHMDRHLLQAELLRGQEPGVPADDHAVFVHDDYLPPAKLLKGCCNLVDRALGNLAGVTDVRDRFSVGHHCTCRSFMPSSQGRL